VTELIRIEPELIERGRIALIVGASRGLEDLHGLLERAARLAELRALAVAHAEVDQRVGEPFVSRPE
jgi:hypothetical protein